MHSSIKLPTPCEFINITLINPLISKCQIKVCYVGEDPNRNGSVITKEVASQMANSLPGSPIVGFYNEEKGDFEGHNRIIDISGGKFKIRDTTQPYGFVDLNAKCWFQKFLDDGIYEREYLMTEGYLWTGQFPEVQRVIDKGNNQSMELDEETLSATWSKDDKGIPQFFIINEAIISKLCILGEDTEPCFEGASISNITFSFEDDFKEKLFSMMTELTELLNEGGAKEMPENNEELEFKKKQDEEEAKAKAAEKQDEGAEEASKDSEESSSKDTSSEKAENQEEGQSEEDKKKKKKDYEAEKCPKCGKPLDECVCEEENAEDKKAKYDLNEIPEYLELQNSYTSLQEECETLKAANAALEAEITPLKEFKAKAEKQEKQNMIDQFYMLSDEDKKDVIDNIDTYSLDDIEAKLSIICVRNKVSFDLEDKGQDKGPTVYNLGSFEDNDDTTPAWVKSALSVAKELNS